MLLGGDALFNLNCDALEWAFSSCKQVQRQHRQKKGEDVQNGRMCEVDIACAQNEKCGAELRRSA